MSFFQITPNLRAGGSINMASFVKGDPANDETAIQAGLGDTALGVAYPGSNTYPFAGSSGEVAASAGESVAIYGSGSIVEVQVGSVAIVRGFVKPDANGYATQAFPGDVATAYSFESAAASTFVRMLVLPPAQTVPGTLITTTATDLTLTAADNGKLIDVTAADKTVTLPAAVKGMKYKILVDGATAATGGTVGTTVAIPGTDTLAGNGFTPAAGKGAVNTDATAVSGDWIELTAVAANSWYVTGIKGTWARVA